MLAWRAWSTEVYIKNNKFNYAFSHLIKYIYVQYIKIFHSKMDINKLS